jgi:hypothetical protein
VVLRERTQTIPISRPVSEFSTRFEGNVQMGRMKHLVGISALLLISGSLLHCANKTDESTYDCV